jgi:probable rRNA maturation factor
MHNRQKRFRLPARKLQAEAGAAARLLARSFPAGLAGIEVSFLTERESGRIHLEFFGDPAPTDVMTFEHGEILICPGIAERQRKASGLSMHAELLTYVIHGMLHLCGWNDLGPGEFEAMAREQDRVRRRVAPGL